MNNVLSDLESLPPVMRADEAAKALSLSPNRLAKMRIEGSSPAFIRAGRSILYTRVSLAEWLAANVRRSTSDTGERGAETAWLQVEPERRGG